MGNGVTVWSKPNRSGLAVVQPSLPSRRRRKATACDLCQCGQQAFQVGYFVKLQAVISSLQRDTSLCREKTRRKNFKDIEKNGKKQGENDTKRKRLLVKLIGGDGALAALYQNPDIFYREFLTTWTRLEQRLTASHFSPRDSMLVWPDTQEPAAQYPCRTFPLLHPQCPIISSSPSRSLPKKYFFP